MVKSESTSATGRPDGLGMNIAGGFQKVQRDAADLGVSVQDNVDAQRSLARLSQAAGGKSTALNSLINRGRRNPNLGFASRNAAIRLLGEQVGAAVMGQEHWAQYIETSCRKMQQLDKPFTFPDTMQVTKTRISGERDG